MRILLVTQYWSPETGVPQRRWAWLSEVLQDSGHEVFVIAPPPRSTLSRTRGTRIRTSQQAANAAVAADSKATVYRSYRPATGDSISAKMLEQLLVAAGQVVVGRKVFKDVEPAIVIGTVPAIPTAVVTFILAKLGRAPYIIDLRDAWPDLLRQADSWNAGVGKKSVRETIAKFGPLQFVSRLTEFALNNVLRKSDAILVTSSNLQQNLLQRSKIQRRGRQPNIEVVRNVFPTENTRVAQRDPGAQPAGTLNVLYAGTIGRAQNLVNALRAARIAKDQGVDLSLTFVGAGASKKYVKQQAEQMGLEARFINQQLPENLERFYSWADTALVHLTEWEPLERTVPSKTYELMELGIHISAVVEGEAADLVSMLEGGDVVEPGNPQKLAELWIALSRDRSRLRVSDAGRKWVEEQRLCVAPKTFLTVVENAKELDS